MQDITRDNLGDAVAQFLAKGGGITEVEPEPPKKHTATQIRQARSRRAGSLKETSPFDVHLSLSERQHEGEIRRCVDLGYSLAQTMKETGLTREPILRLLREFGLELRGTIPKGNMQTIQALAELYARGLNHATACKRLHIEDAREAAALYAAHLASNPEAPTPPVVSQISDEGMLSVIILGLKEGKSLIAIADENGYDVRQAHTVYSRHRTRTRRLLSEARRHKHG